MADVIEGGNDISTQVWAAMFVFMGAFLGCIGEPEVALMLIGGGLALLQHK